MATCSPACFVRRSHFLGREKSKSKTKRGPRKKGTREKGGQRDRREEVFSETMNERVSLSVRDFLEMLPYLKIFPIPSNALQWRSIEGLCEDRQASSTPQGYLVGREAASLQTAVQVTVQGSVQAASLASLTVQGRSQVRGQMGRLLR